VQLSRSLKLCAILALSGCASPRLNLPEYCSPIASGAVVCEDRTYLFPAAGDFMCFLPHEIEPFLNRCGK
jgi:hypothetical protein